MMTIKPSQAQPDDVIPSRSVFGAQTVVRVHVWPDGDVQIVFVGGLVLNTPDCVPLTVRREGAQ